MLIDGGLIDGDGTDQCRNTGVEAVHLKQNTSEHSLMFGFGLIFLYDICFYM